MGNSVKDVVCGREVSPVKGIHISAYQDQIYYFCSSGCKKAFDKEPHKYVNTTQEHDLHHH